jgi:hypothetical protein
MQMEQSAHVNQEVAQHPVMHYWRGITKEHCYSWNFENNHE